MKSIFRIFKKIFALILKKISGIKIRLMIGAIIALIITLALNTVILTSVLQIFLEREKIASQLTTLDSISSSILFDENNFPIKPYIGNLDFDKPFSGHYWQINFSNGITLRSRSLWDGWLNTPELTNGTSRISRINGPNDYTLIATERIVKFPNNQLTMHAIVASVDAISKDKKYLILQIIIISIIFPAIAMIIAFLFQISWGITPIYLLRHSLKKVMEGKYKKTKGYFGKELTPIASYFNLLILRQEKILEDAKETSRNLSHSLRTPLAILSVEIEKLKKKKTSGGFTVIDLQLDRMKNMVSIESINKAKTTCAYCDMSKRIETLMKAFKRIYKNQQKQRLRVVLNCPKHFIVETSAENIDEMLGNLLDNAFKWCKSQVAVTIEYIKKEEMAVVIIEDDGDGLTKTNIQKVFTRGLRLDQSIPGEGLGLAITKKIAELQGGSIKLTRSKKLKGLRCELKLPATNPFRKMYN